MAKSEICVLTAVLFIFASIDIGESVRCFVCSLESNQFCNDPFNASLTAHNQWGSVSTQHNLVDCDQQSQSYNSYLRKTVCKKVKQTINGHETIIRSCEWVSPDTAVGECKQSTTPSYINIKYCGTCETDGCNSAPSQFATGVHYVLMLVPAFFTAKLAKF